MKGKPPETVVVPPEFSFDGNVGIEQVENYLGVYTKCCYGNAEYSGMVWECDECGARVSFGIGSYYTTILNLHESSSADIAAWVADWLNRPRGVVGAEVSWDKA